MRPPSGSISDLISIRVDSFVLLSRADYRPHRRLSSRPKFKAALVATLLRPLVIGCKTPLFLGYILERSIPENSPGSTQPSEEEV
jgi:hypothetical protein